MARVLYFVTSYRNPEQVLRLVRTLRRESPAAEILVHHDRFRTILDIAQVDRAAPGAHLLTSEKPLSWGDFSVVDMHWRCFKWALDHTDFDWIVLLSEQDYPVWPLADSEDFLLRSEFDIFIKAHTVDATTEWPLALGYNRYFYSYSAVPGAALLHRIPAPWALATRRWRQRLVNVVNNRPGRLVRAETYPDGIPTRFGVRRNAVPFSGSFACWVGKAWFAMSRRAAAEVIAFIESHPSYRKYYRWTIVPEESATASIVLNAPGLRVAARDLHFERWSDHYSGHPDVFRSQDLDEIVSSGMPFARKFDLGVDREVLDLLDSARLRPTTSDDVVG